MDEETMAKYPWAKDMPAEELGQLCTLVDEIVCLYRNGFVSDGALLPEGDPTLIEVAMRRSDEGKPFPFPPPSELALVRSLLLHDQATLRTTPHRPAWDELRGLVVFEGDVKDQDTEEALKYFDADYESMGKRFSEHEMQFPILAIAIGNPQAIVRTLANHLLFALMSPEGGTKKNFMLLLDKLVLRKDAIFDAGVFPHTVLRYPLDLATTEFQHDPGWVQTMGHRVKWVRGEIPDRVKNVPQIPGVAPLFCTVLRYACSVSKAFLPPLYQNLATSISWYQDSGFYRPGEDRTAPKKGEDEGGAKEGVREYIAVDMLRVALPQTASASTDVLDFCMAVRALRGVCFASGDELNRSLFPIFQLLSLPECEESPFQTFKPYMTTLWLSLPTAQVTDMVEPVPSSPRELPKGPKGSWAVLEAVLQQVHQWMLHTVEPNQQAIWKHVPSQDRSEEWSASMLALFQESDETCAKAGKLLAEHGLVHTTLAADVLVRKASLKLLLFKYAETKSEAGAVLENFPFYIRSYLPAIEASRAENKFDEARRVMEFGLRKAYLKAETLRGLLHLRQLLHEKLELMQPALDALQARQKVLVQLEEEDFALIKLVEEKKQSKLEIAEKLQQVLADRKGVDAKADGQKKLTTTKERQLQSIRDNMKKEKTKAATQRDNELQRLLNEVGEEQKKATNAEKKLETTRVNIEEAQAKFDEQIESLRAEVEAVESDLQEAEFEFAEWKDTRAKKGREEQRRSAAAPAAATQNATTASASSDQSSTESDSEGGDEEGSESAKGGRKKKNRRQRHRDRSLREKAAAAAGEKEEKKTTPTSAVTSPTNGEKVSEKPQLQKFHKGKKTNQPGSPGSGEGTGGGFVIPKPKSSLHTGSPSSPNSTGGSSSSTSPAVPKPRSQQS